MNALVTELAKCYALVTERIQDEHTGGNGVTRLSSADVAC
jgi:hypothetical protein